MAIRREFVRKNLGEYVIPVMNVELKEDMEVGMLFAIEKSSGKAIKADHTGWSAPANEKPAIGVIPYSSLEGWGEKFEFNRKEILKAGEIIDVYTYGILYSPEIVEEIIKAESPSPEAAFLSETPKMKNEAEAMAKYINKPVYLGKQGLVTLAEPAGSANNGVQIVGYLANPKTGAVRLMLNNRGAKKE